jgi:transcriptional regulator with GAF, ATPase, and Fis domain
MRRMVQKCGIPQGRVLLYNLVPCYIFWISLSYLLYTRAMERYHELLAVWQVAGRHIEIDEALTRIAFLLSDTLTVQNMCLYFVDPHAKRVECLSFVSLRDGRTAPPHAAFDPHQVNRLAVWCKSGGPLQFAQTAPPPHIAPLVTAGMGAYALALPLIAEHGTLGVLLMGGADKPFSNREERFAGLLREPLAVALENDRRWHELVAWREAAEADKRKLLHRLGREELRDEIVGANDGLRAVMERVALVTRSDVPVLILGETGSGKEVIARAIHDGSPRSSSPFIRVNCGAIPTELIDSELFGHERGSFTGATGTRKGWFERADGGTLLLDEIGELPAAAQVRLLRVLQDGSFERVGGEQPLRVNVRIITATHRDLARMVQEHAFREDLWYRVAVFPIVLPPLRERKQDIPALAINFAERAARRFGLRLQLPTAEDLALLTGYDWPGNVREFASVLDRAAILGDGACLEVAKALGIVPPRRGPGGPVATPRQEGAIIATLDEAMRRHIERALAVTRGKVEGAGGAATLLEINPHTLRARMRKLGIMWKTYRN